MGDFDFDEWADLYKKDPDAFEVKRRQAVESLIQQAPVHTRSSLRVLQIKCDAARDPANPGDVSGISKLLAENLGQLGQAMTDLKQVIDK